MKQTGSFIEGPVLAPLLRFTFPVLLALFLQAKVDVAKLAPIVFDPINNAYHKLGEKAGNAFQDGLKLK